MLEKWVWSISFCSIDFLFYFTIFKWWVHWIWWDTMSLYLLSIKTDKIIMDNDLISFERNYNLCICVNASFWTFLCITFLVSRMYVNASLANLWTGISEFAGGRIMVMKKEDEVLCFSFGSYVFLCSSILSSFVKTKGIFLCL